MTAEGRPERFEQFCDDYRVAWRASHEPSAQTVREIFAAALAAEPSPSADVHALLVFFRTELQKQVPLNWFCGEETWQQVTVPPTENPYAYLEQFAHRLGGRFKW